MPAHKDILTAAEFTAMQKGGAFIVAHRANHALHRLGSVEIFTTTSHLVFAVIHDAKLTPDNTREIELLLQGARARTAPETAEAPPATPTS